MEKKQKRFYKKNEVVWVIDEKKEGIVKAINKDTYEVTVEVKEGNIKETLTLKVWEIDKLKYKAKEELVKSKKKTSATDNSIREELEGLKRLINSIMHPEVFFSKLSEDAIVPTKRKEDAGYDVYANFTPDEATGFRNLICPKLQTTLVPTKIAMALPDTHYFNTKHERGSTGKIAMSVLAGVIDSGYRNELFIAIAPLKKDVVITDRVESVIETEDYILYPYSKAIAQGTIDLVADAETKVITYEELLKMESERGLTNLGASGK